MKKNYTKPYIVVETFQLDAAIADSCSSEGKQALNFDGYKTCTALEEVGVKYFSTACDPQVVLPDGTGNDTLCYHGPISPDLFMNS